jgi:hypothetical protein
MKNRFLWASAAALAVTVGSQVQTLGLTNGFIVLSSRTASDALYRQISSSTLYDADDFKGPGVVSPGDAAMAALLQDYGYSTRLVPEWLLSTALIDPQGVYSGVLPAYFYPTGEAPDWIYGGAGGPTKTGDTNNNFSAQLVIVSGSGSSFDMPPPNTRGIPIIMGEHSCVGDVPLNGHSSIYMYGLKDSSDATFTAAQTPGDIQYMKVLAPTHPIMQGIPLDAQGRVKIWRDPYPEENAHVPTGGKINYLPSWLRVNIAPSATTVVAAGTQIIGVRADNLNHVVFAVNPVGGALYDGTGGGNPAPADFNGNLVHFFVNERGSGDSRRAFCHLTDIGKVIFIRTCKWAMGETLTPYVPLGLIQTTLVSPNKIKLEWTGAATKSYKVLGTANLLGAGDFSNWQTVVQDIAGVDPGVGPTSVKLDISNGPQYAFLRVTPVP